MSEVNCDCVFEHLNDGFSLSSVNLLNTNQQLPKSGDSSDKKKYGHFTRPFRKVRLKPGERAGDETTVETRRRKLNSQVKINASSQRSR